jgi:DNA-binding NarL/FixJ family response regulator
MKQKKSLLEARLEDLERRRQRYMQGLPGMGDPAAELYDRLHQELLKEAERMARLARSARGRAQLQPPPIVRPKERRRRAVELRRLEVARLARKGWRDQEIADRLGVSKATVSRDLAAIKAALTE